MSLADLFANEEALRAALSSALHDANKAAALAAATAQAASDALAAHGTAKSQLIDALNVPVEPSE